MRGRGAAAPADKCAEKHCGEHACMHHELYPERIDVVFFYEHRYDEHNCAYNRAGYRRGVICGTTEDPRGCDTTRKHPAIKSRKRQRQCERVRIGCLICG